MGFNDDLAESLADLFEAAGQDAILTRGGVDEVPCHVDIMRGVDLQPGDFNAQVSGNSIVIEFILSEIITEPDRGDTVSVGEAIYTVESIAENDEYVVRAVVK